ncbi:MAG: VOC family protein [Isosphaeraceae bacterium]|jgi:glyoxylase I family protein
MAALAFHHVALTCNDPLAIERYYTKHFGFQRARVVSLGGGKPIVFLKSGAFYLELFQSEQASPVPSPAPIWPQYPGGDGPHYHGVRHLAFKVDDVDAQLARMGAEAVLTLGPLSFDSFIPGWKSAWLADPEGNIVEVSQGFVDQQNPPPAP